MNNFAGKLGIVRTRDLVALYFGARFVTTIQENQLQVASPSVSQILAQDLRRIRYEVVISNPNLVPVEVQIGSPVSIQNSKALDYQIPANSDVTIDRNWLSDAEAVCLPISIQCLSNSVFVSTRETFLTPPPVDEDLTD